MKCFLSHSASDKGHYVSVVARNLAPNIEYDELTFEEGMETVEEIMRAMSRSDIFVLFLSNASLNSTWVNKEITQAKMLLDIGDLKRFFPLIIERDITHSDERIPDWIKSNYNLRPITRPSVAVKRIRERMVEVSWKTHPMLKDRDQIFVGRNQQIDEFEKRIDDLSKDQPVVIVASGLRDIGRKSILRYCLRKSNTVRETYEPIHIDLVRDDYIEGFIVKLNDLGFSDNIDTSKLMEKTPEEKVSICCRLLSEIFASREILLIEDHYCLVRYEREFAPWFLDVVEKLEHRAPGMCIASSARPSKYRYVRDSRFFFMEIPELQKSEREGLFRRYSETLKLQLYSDDYEKFSPLLTGFPEQVTYAVSLIETLGITNAFKKADEIVAFSTHKASILMKKYEGEEEVLSFLRFISSFEFVSLDFVIAISKAIDQPLEETLDRFVGDSVCEVIGHTGQYFRVNEVIRDAIARDRTKLTAEYREALIAYVNKFSSSYEAEYYDVSEYYIAVKEALSTGIYLPESILIPAHFLKTMKDLYTKRYYREVIALADRVLLKEEYYDDFTSQNIRYYLCQSLARTQDVRFTSEVQKIHGPEHDFLFGFYYRLKGQFDKALERYYSARAHSSTEQRASREIVLVLTTIEAYEEALSLAKENYERYRSNPYLVQAYFQCLLHTANGNSDNDKLKAVLEDMRQIEGARATEMYDTLAARFEFKIGNRAKAFEMIDTAISTHDDVPFPLVAKLDMAVHEMDGEVIRSCVKKLEKASDSSWYKMTILKAKIVLMALDGDFRRAERMIEKDMGQLSHSVKERLRRRIRSVVDFNQPY